FRSRAEAAILEARGDTAGALEKLTEVEAAIRRLPESAQRETLLRLLERWKSSCRRAAPEPMKMGAVAAILTGACCRTEGGAFIGALGPSESLTRAALRTRTCCHEHVG